MTDTAPETSSERRVRATVTRRFVRDPLIWGIAFLIAAIIWTLAGDDLSFFPFLLMLLGGWGIAFSFVTATMEMRPARTGALVHIAVAVALTALMIAVIQSDGDLLAALSEPVRAVVVVLQIAAGPAVGWIWLGLLSRVADLFARRDATTRTPPTPPEWKRDESGDGSRVEFPAVDLRMRALTLGIIAVVLVVGLAGTALLIAFDDVVMRMGARILIIVMGVAVGLPVYLIGRALFVAATHAFVCHRVRQRRAADPRGGGEPPHPVPRTGIARVAHAIGLRQGRGAGRGSRSVADRRTREAARGAHCGTPRSAATCPSPTRTRGPPRRAVAS